MTAAALLALAAAGSAGAVVRYFAAVALPARGSLPWGVLVVNVVGSFLAGLGIAAIDDPVLTLALVTGFCGGLTTFSTHAIDSVRLVTGEIGRSGRAVFVRVSLAVGNVVVTLALSLGGVLAGVAVGGGVPGG
jgi:fluoride exporter